ncbi:MAG: hypothetical protein HZB55_04315 [Deltaproteobacteria bacterium]|nr:hypothetical protein [Deltaproteobacteria bacterium]
MRLTWAEVSQKWGLAGRLVVPVVLLFVAFTAALGFWVSHLSRSVFLQQAEEHAVSVDAAARARLEAEWALSAELLGNPALQQRLLPLIQAGNIDALERALRTLPAASRVSFVNLYDPTGALLASSGELSSKDEPGSLHAVAQAALARREGSISLVNLPTEALAFQGLAETRCRGPGGSAVGVMIGTPLTDDFGEPLGLLLGCRLLNGDQALVREIGTIVGADVTLLHGPTRVATTLPGPRGGPATDQAAPAEVPEGLQRGAKTVSLLETSAGRTFASAYRRLPVQGAGAPLALGISVPVSDFLRRADQIQVSVFVAGLLALLAFSALLTITVRRSLRPVPVLLEHMRAVAGGDLAGVCDVRTRDELEMLSSGINETVLGLRDLLAGVTQAFRQVEEVAESVRAAAGHLAEGAASEATVLGSLDRTARQLSGVVDVVGSEARELQTAAAENLEALRDLSRSVDESAAHSADLVDASGETELAVQEMSSSVSETATNVSSLSDLLGRSATAMGQIDASISQVRELTARSREVARSLATEADQRGRSAMDTAAARMAAARTLVETLGATVQTVGTRSTEIGQIVTLISEVAGRTKLLALNAAILAAQAGEQGLGFSVVAANIRELSDRTNASTRAIAGLIQGIQREIGRAVEEADRGTAAVTESSDAVAQVAQALDSILADAASARDLAERIAAETDHQAESSSEVASSILNLASMGQQLAAATQEQEATAGQILVVTQKMGEGAQSVRDAAQDQAARLLSVTGKVQGTADAADRLLHSAEQTTRAASVLSEAVDVIGRVLGENRERIGSLNSSVGALSDQADRVRERLSRFELGPGA